MSQKAKLPKLAIGLLHYPMKDRRGNVVATNITNFDIHDIARVARCYGVPRYYLIHPVPEQLMFVERVLDHWRVGEGARYNETRRVSLEPVRTAASLEQALKDWRQFLGSGDARILKIVTHARTVPQMPIYLIKELREMLWEDHCSVFLIFGTGYGMTDDFMRKQDGLLESLKGAPPDDFRHLSVRSAVSIYLDRLLGPW
ncbi:MAG: RNA methyltransferase [Bdellovibrionaceae bacterium]|nr:RNA methyltransferase [Pseudobdellovibrionaceae bacterium]MDW8189530.1 RNA methyltransferase [Pseudobdellovibrionaceae bacterium]